MTGNMHTIRIEDIFPKFYRVAVSLSGPCNYRCHYCHVDHKRLDEAPVGRFSTDEGTEKLVAMLDTIGTCSVGLIGGGEAFLKPNFFDLCRRIAVRHFVGITTNFSMPIEPFMNAVPPEKSSSFTISLHPDGVRTLDDFFSRARIMHEAGYPLTVIFVAHPDRMKQIPELYDRFMSAGILFKVAPFNGLFNGKKYPVSYSPDEVAFLLPYIVDPLSRYPLKGHVRHHNGKPCASGYSSFTIFEEDGRIQRCHNTPHLHGNVFSGDFKPLSRPAPCTAEFCHCDFCLEEQAFLANYYGSFAGSALPPVSDKTNKEYERICRPLIYP